MNLIDAKKIAINFIEKNMQPIEGDKYIIVDQAIKEDSEGWYFPYQSERFIKTGDINFSLVGNWPIFVSKKGECLGARRFAP